MGIRHRQDFTGVSARGLSLVELLVSLLLGLLLSAGMVSAYLGAKRHSFYEEQSARMQENGRYAMRLLSRELAMAGFFAGVPSMADVAPGAVGTDCADDNWVLDAGIPLELVNDHVGDTSPVSMHATEFACLDGAEIAPDTDLLAIKRTAAAPSLQAGVPAAALTAATSESWFLLTVSGRPDAWQKLRPIDLRDIGRAQPEHSYWEASTRIFYIRPYSESGNESEDLPTLCMETLAGDGMTSRCLVEGVENIQLEYGIDYDDDGVPNRYVSAPDAGEMSRVVTVKIHLLLRSIAALAGHSDDKVYRLGLKEVPARRDAFLRRVFTSTVLLRNTPRAVG
jgi:type IV pilus assembly protein PilW